MFNNILFFNNANIYQLIIDNLKMSDVQEAKEVLVQSLGEELSKQYFDLFKQLLRLRGGLTKIQFNNAARKLFTNEEQLHNHNNFMLLFYDRITSSETKALRNASDKGYFEAADYMDYLPQSPPVPPSDLEERSAASELFLPDSGFIINRIMVTSWEKRMDGAEEKVVDILVQACQMFVKNIITAMLTRLEGYKIRDGKFQYGFGLPVPDPFIRNTNNIIDSTKESKVEVAEDEDSFIPAYKHSIDVVEQQAAFSYSCGKNYKGVKKLTVKLLYETLREDQRIVGLHSIHDVNLLQMALLREESKYNE